MTKAKSKEIDEPVDPAAAIDDVEEAPEVAVPEVAPVARKSLGVKEPIIFLWKIVGHANGLALTLFKSVEREDADAQLERLTRDGYYTNLEIMEATAKVVQPQPPKEVKKAAKPREETKSSPRAESRKTAKSAPSKRGSAARRPAARKPAAKSASKSSSGKSTKTASRKLAKKK